MAHVPAGDRRAALVVHDLPNAFLGSQERRRRLVESQDGDLDAMPAVLGHARLMFEARGDLFERIDVRPAIERSIAALPEPHHTILVLVDLEDHSYEEAAAILEIPVGTVRSRLFRARRMIQEALIAYAEDAGLGAPRRREDASRAVSPRMPEPIEFPPDCEAVVRALWYYLDGMLEAPDMDEIDAHLADCEYCREHVAFERRLLDEIAALRRRHDDPVALRSRVLDALRRTRRT